MARLALITALLFTTVVGFIFLTGFSGEDKGILPAGDSRGVSALPGEGTTMLSEEEIHAVVAERFPEAGILGSHLVAGGGFEVRLLFGNASYDVTLSSGGAIINIAAATPSDVSASDASPQEGTAATVPGTLVSKPRILNAAAVLLHSTASDCWLIINSKVYNVTSYLSEHPGGAASIITYCGKEATATFETKDKTIPKPHSSFATGLLDAYYVGFLGQVLSGTETPTKGGTSVSEESAQATTKPTTSASAPKEIPLPQFTVGDTVKTTSVLNVRDGASTKQTILGKQEIGARGVIVSGPIFTNGYWWWKIDWQSIPDGWSVGDFLALIPTAVAPENIPPAPTPTTIPSTQMPSTGITASEVAAHNTRADCWVIFENKVYNVTLYISSHPGGASAITAYCGADLTAAFVAQGHSQNARSLFANYYVGDLSTSTTPPTTTTPSSTTVPPPTDPLQPYRDAIYAKYPNANITKLQLEDNGKAEFKFTYNGKTYEGKMNAQYQITKIE
ncbi:MAG: hypothetical protein NUV49_03815 [Patescibacteria group bacterium]|nr:hypothetical protein [Patescibacteria group bacterium]